MGDERVSSISEAGTDTEIGEFWDTHSLADHDDETHEVEMTFEASARRTAVNIDTELLDDVRRIAHARHVSAQTLVNLWLRERVDQVAASASQAD
jgi:hypothetical protein